MNMNILHVFGGFLKWSIYKWFWRSWHLPVARLNRWTFDLEPKTEMPTIIFIWALDMFAFHKAEHIFFIVSRLKIGLGLLFPCGGTETLSPGIGTSR